jgi:hypothetical protein
MPECSFCKNTLTYAGLSKHIYTDKHKHDLLNGLLTTKKYILERVEKREYELLGTLPYIKVGSEYIHLCFGCKKTYHTRDHTKKHQCDKKLIGLQIVVDMIKDKQPVAKPTPGNQVDVSKMKAQMEQYKKLADKAIDQEGCLTAVMRYLFDKHPAIYREAMGEVEECSQEVHEQLYIDIESE